LPAPTLARVWYVNAGSTQSPQDGSSFAQGFHTIQAGIDASADSDDVYVATGIYAENLTVGKAVSLRGGYAGTDATTRDAASYPTTIDGGGKGPAAVFTLFPASQYGNFLDGFTIQNGAGKVYLGQALGGGVIWDTYGTISNCYFVNNSAPSSPSYGGAIACPGNDGLLVQNCAFSGNSAVYGGAIGALATAGSFSTFTVDHCNFNNNGQGTAGGAIYVKGPFYKGAVTNSTFTTNTALFGGAIELDNATNQTIAGNVFTSNKAHPYGNGGALMIEKSDPVLVELNLFSANTAESYGGGIYADTPGATSVAINNNVLAGNVANAFSFTGINGGGIVSGGAYVVNNTFADSPGSALSISSPSFTANNIFAFNGVAVTVDSSIVPGPIHNNDVFGNTGGDYGGIADPTGTSGNIRKDPVFVNHAGADFHLQGSSPCIDAGNTSDASAYAGPYDYDGEPRIQGPSVDIGADEFMPTLVFTQQPGNARPGQLLPSQPVVTVMDRAGNPVSGYNAPVTMIISTPFAGSAIIHGTTQVNTVNGVATFTDLSIDKPYRGYVMRALGIPFESGDSIPFDVLYARSYVTPTGSDTQDGITWATARQTPKAAFDITGGPNGEVWAAIGTYAGPVDIPDGVTLYGGFSGTETSLDQRNAQSRRTVIDGGHVNAAVRFLSGTGNGINGCKITNGIGAPVATSLLSTHREGGGVYVRSASPTIANNLITGNSATLGGGIAIDGGRPEVLGNVIEINNVAAMTNLIGGGGGVYIGAGNGTVIADNFIVGNTATGETTAHVPSVGGAMVLGGTQNVHNNTFSVNQCPVGQGDIYIVNGSTAFINNIIENHAAIERIAGTPTFSHNDYVPGAAVANELPNPDGSNGNFNAAVTFVNAAAGNFHLPPGSQLMDRGDVTAIRPGETDIDGQPRVMGPGVDIGADEVAVPYTLTDAASALAFAGGLQAASLLDALRLRPEGPGGIDVGDAILLARRAAGLDPNP
jgi:hypothetical protein